MTALLDIDHEGAHRLVEKIVELQDEGAIAVRSAISISICLMFLQVVIVSDRDALASLEIDQGDIYGIKSGFYSWREKEIRIPIVTMSLAEGVRFKTMINDKDRDLYVSMDFTDTLPVRQHVDWQFWTSSHCDSEEECEKHASFASVQAPLLHKVSKG